VPIFGGQVRHPSNGGQDYYLSGGLEERIGGGVFELLEEAVLIPVLPGFDEAAVLEAEEADASDFDVFAGGGVFCGARPSLADHVAFGDYFERSDLNVGQLGAKGVVETLEVSGAAIVSGAVVEDAVVWEHFVDGFASRFVPDFFEPSSCKSPLSFLLAGHGDDLLRGGL